MRTPIIVLSLLFLAACGNKTGLTLPPPAETAKPPAVAPDNSNKADKAAKEGAK